MSNYIQISEFIGKTFTGIEKTADTITFTVSEDESYLMFHQQDCCERVTIEDISGELGDITGSPILQAEEVSNSEEPKKSEWDESFTWTFYKLATIKGYVTIRWYGTSNGYYSESVDIIKQ